jgi:DNA-binding CsgD family transcriptional regulator
MTDDPELRRLTLGESRVARLVAAGLSDEQIAVRLGITVVGVGADLSEIFRKLGLRSRTELALLLPDEVTGSTGADGAATGG